MVNTIKNNGVRWMSPSPLWGERSSWMGLPMQNHPLRPVILRFANDMFMDELIAMLTHSPWRFEEWVIKTTETWRAPMANPRPIEATRPAVNLPDSYNKMNRLMQNYPKAVRAAQIKSRIKTPATVPQNSSEEPIKLYHANHQRYYIVTSSLVSEEKGYPDYSLNHGKDEKATFVVRALLKNETDSNYDEYGFVATSAGMAWRKVGKHDIESAAAQRTIPNEERLPLFPLSYPDGCGRLRKVFGGLIPVGKRDEWIDAPECSTNGNSEVEIVSPVPAHDGGIDHYREILYNDVIAPWKALIDRTETDKRKNNINKNSFLNFEFDADNALLDKIRNVRAARDEIQTGSWYVLHDFARFLQDHIPNVWNKVNASMNAQSDDLLTLTNSESELADILMSTKMDDRLFIELAIENLAISGFVSESEVSLWDSLNAFWMLEAYLKLSSILYESQSYTDTLRNKVTSLVWPGFGAVFLGFIDRFRRQSNPTFLDFAQQLGDEYPTIKIAAIKGTAFSSQSEPGRLVKILQEIQLPIVKLDAFKAINKELSGVDIKTSMWDMLSFYWKFEVYVDVNVADETSDTVISYLHSGIQPGGGSLEDMIIKWFYEGKDTKDWYSFIQFACDLDKLCPSLHTVAILDAFGIAGEDIRLKTEDLTYILKNAEITKDINEEIAYSNPDKRKVRIIPSLAEALIETLNWTDVLENVNTPYDRSKMGDSDVRAKAEWWPDFLFPLADPEPWLSLKHLTETDEDSVCLEQSYIIPSFPEGAEKASTAEDIKSRLDELADKIDALTPKESLGDGTSTVLGLTPLLKEKNPQFVIRFIFERPQCGILFPTLVSQASRRLEMALFMDPDAPARTVRIHMPLDVSPAGLRKYKKNAMFVLSDMMCGKMKNIRKLTLADLVLSVLPWPFHKDLPDVGSNAGPCPDGLICSLSIPIVTLCALILVFIIVTLFEIIFKWMPWFFACFPVPGLSNLKAKE